MKLKPLIYIFFTLFVFAIACTQQNSNKTIAEKKDSVATTTPIDLNKDL